MKDLERLIVSAVGQIAPCLDGLPRKVTPRQFERWADIPGFGGDYRVSTGGQVWSRLKNHRRSGMLSPSPNGRGYPTVTLHRRTHSVHVLVYRTFTGPIPGGQVVCHWNDDPLDNRWQNLTAASRRENANDSLFNQNAGSVNRAYPDIEYRWGRTAPELQHVLKGFANLTEVFELTQASFAATEQR